MSVRTCVHVNETHECTERESCCPTVLAAAAAHRCSALLAFWPDVIGYFGYEGAADIPLWFLLQDTVLKHGRV